MGPVSSSRFNAARGNLLVQFSSRAPRAPYGAKRRFGKSCIFRHTLLTQEKHTLQNHDVNPCFPFCDTVYTHFGKCQRQNTALLLYRRTFHFPCTMNQAYQKSYIFSRKFTAFSSPPPMPLAESTAFETVSSCLECSSVRFLLSNRESRSCSSQAYAEAPQWIYHS